MNENRRYQQQNKQQGRSRGACRNGYDEQQSADMQSLRMKRRDGSCRKPERLQSGRCVSDALTAESVTGSETRDYTSSLQTLKDKASRLAQALQNIEAQIKLSERQ